MTDNLISRQAAILQLSHNKCGNDENDIAVEHDIETIRELPSVQQEPTAYVEFWRKRADYYSDMCFKLIADMGAGVKIGAIKIDETGITFTEKKLSTQPEQICKYWDSESKFCSLCRPSAQPERKVGKWIKKMQITETTKWSSYDPRWYCSYCHTEYDPAIANEINFCWNCGARMEGDGDEAD